MSGDKSIFRFDTGETFSLFWICSNAFRSYSAFKSYEKAYQIFNKMAYAPIMNSYHTTSKGLIKPGVPTEESTPYSIMTGKVKTSDKSLKSIDGQSDGVVRCVRNDLEFLFSVLNFKRSFSINIDKTFEAVPFVMYNKEHLTSFHVEPLASNSLEMLESNLEEVSRNVAPIEESILNWIIEVIPGCKLFVTKVVTEKMLRVNTAVTVMGKALMHSQNRRIFVSNPGNNYAPYIITIRTPQAVLRSVHREVNRRLGLAIYFGLMTLGLTAVDFYLQYTRKRRSVNVFRSKITNIYFCFLTFGLPIILNRYSIV